MSQSFVRSSAICYCVLFLVSLVVAYWQDRLDAIFGFSTWSQTVNNASIGLLLAMGVVLAGAALRGTFKWAEKVEEELALLLGPLRIRDIVVLALTSGVAEEVFFRATMQPLCGLVLTSLTFGLLHLPVNRRLIPWTILAVGMGFLFGIIYRETDSLLAIVIGHCLINFFELVVICRRNHLNSPK